MKRVQVEAISLLSAERDSEFPCVRHSGTNGNRYSVYSTWWENVQAKVVDK